MLSLRPDSNYEKYSPYKEFLENLTDTVKDYSNDHTLILGIDANWKLNRSSKPPPEEEGERKYLVLGKFGLLQTNERGLALKNFLSMIKLCATNTFVKKRNYGTKNCTLNDKLYATDFIITKEKDRKYIHELGIAKNYINSDRRAVYVKIKTKAITRKIKKQQPKKQNKVTQPKVTR